MKTRTRFFLTVAGVAACCMLSAATVTYVAKRMNQKTAEVYLACHRGHVTPVLRDGTLPIVRTDSGRPMACSEGVVNDRI